MKIKYDKIADAKYITLAPRKKVARTQKQEAWLLFDYDKQGQVIGVEILAASRHPVAFSISKNSVRYFPVKYTSGAGGKKKTTRKKGVANAHANEVFLSLGNESVMAG